jgi:PAS domain S-box-containing protein
VVDSSSLADGDDTAESLVQTVFEHANDAIFVVDVENDAIVDANPAAESLVEYSRSELLSMPASDLHPHNLSEFMDFADSVFQQGRGWTDDITCYCKSGDIIPAEMSASVVEVDGRTLLVNHIRETSTRAERDWFEALIEHASSLITVVKPDGTVRYQSTSVSNVLGHQEADIVHEQFTAFVHPDDVAAVEDTLEQTVAATTAVTNRVEYRFRRADGSWAWLDSIVSYRPDTPITGVVVNARDVTARRESHQQAAVLNRVLRHNLRNGLAVLLGHAETLTEAESPDVTATGEAIISKVWDLQDISDYSKDLTDILESEQVPQQEYDLATLVDQVLPEPAQRDDDLTITVEVPPESYVSAAPKIDVAISHVVRNAIEHNNADSPRVRIHLDEDGPESDYLHLCVEDNGPGIPEQEQQVLLDGEETPLKHGSGLGLWLVNWIINRSGGRIRFEQIDPRGSCVKLIIPTADDPGSE